MKVEIDGEEYVLPFVVSRRKLHGYLIEDQSGNLIGAGYTKPDAEYIAAALNEKAAREAEK